MKCNEVLKKFHIFMTHTYLIHQTINDRKENWNGFTTWIKLVRAIGIVTKLVPRNQRQLMWYQVLLLRRHMRQLMWYQVLLLRRHMMGSNPHNLLPILLKILTQISKIKNKNKKRERQHKRPKNIIITRVFTNWKRSLA